MQLSHALHLSGLQTQLFKYILLNQGMILRINYFTEHFSSLNVVSMGHVTCRSSFRKESRPCIKFLQFYVTYLLSLYQFLIEPAKRTMIRN